MVNDNRSRPPRQRVPVLVLSHPDGHLEVFAERHVDVHLARVPVAHSREAEVTAEDLAEMRLPLRYQPLFQRDHLRASGTTRPLLPTVLARAMATNELIAALNLEVAQ